MKDQMTIFYSKSSGKIVSATSGQTDMGYFGDDENDFKKIYDYIHVESDDYVLDNINQFEVNDGELKFIPPQVPEKYK